MKGGGASLLIVSNFNRDVCSVSGVSDARKG